MGRTSVLLDHKVQLLAEEKHRRLYHEDINLSAFFRMCLEAWVYSADDPRPLWQQTTDIVEQIKKERHEQQQLIKNAEFDRLEREKKEAEKHQVIEQSVREAVAKLGFRREWIRDAPGYNFAHHRKELEDEVSIACSLDLQWKDLAQIVSDAVIGSEP